jgi:hypothetical protein
MGYNSRDENHRRANQRVNSKLCFPTWILQNRTQPLTDAERNARIEHYAKQADLGLDLFETEKTE